MPTSLKRLLSISSTFIFLFAMLTPGITTAAAKSPHGSIFIVNAVGGTNSATVTWKVEYYHYMLFGYSFYIQVYPRNHPFKTQMQTVGCHRSPCKFSIPTPKAHIGAHPDPLKYYFTVVAAGGAGIKPVTFTSEPSADVIVKFQSVSKPTPTPSPTSTPTPSPTSTPSPSPTSTPSPSPTSTPSPSPTSTPSPSPTSTPSPSPTSTVLSANDFDGNYSGVLNVALTPALLSPQTIPLSFGILNGTGSGGGGGWYAAGYVTDAQGTALISISHPLYGTFDFSISFTRVTSTQVKTGAASGTRTINYPGLGEIIIAFSFSLSTS